MKKFYFFMLGAFAAANFAAAETVELFKWANPENNPDYVAEAGVIEHLKGTDNRINYPNTPGYSLTPGDTVKVTYNTICLNGKKADIGKTNYMEVSFTEPLKAGDVIEMTAFRNKDVVNKGASAYVVFSNKTNTTIGGTGGLDFVNINADGETPEATEPNTITYTITEANAGSTYMQMTRDASGTTLFITSLIVKGEREQAAVYDAAFKGDLWADGTEFTRNSKGEITTTVTWVEGNSFAVVFNGETLGNGEVLANGAAITPAAGEGNITLDPSADGLDVTLTYNVYSNSLKASWTVPAAQEIFWDNTAANYAAPYANYTKGWDGTITSVAMIAEIEKPKTIVKEWYFTEDEGFIAGTNTGAIAGLTLTGNFTMETASTTVDGIACTNRLKSGGKSSWNKDGSPKDRVIAVPVPGNATLTLIYSTGSNGSSRELQLYKNSNSTKLTSYTTDATALSTYEYTGEAANLLIAFAANMQVRYIKVEYPEEVATMAVGEPTGRWTAALPWNANYVHFTDGASQYTTNEEVENAATKATLYKVAAEHVYFLGDTELVSAIEAVEAVEATEAVYYNLQGMRVANPETGHIYIRVTGNKSAKVRF